MSSETEREHMGRIHKHARKASWAPSGRDCLGVESPEDPSQPDSWRWFSIPTSSLRLPTLCLFQDGFEVAEDFGGIRFKEVSYQI